jgi:hypothetical protein
MVGDALAQATSNILHAGAGKAGGAGAPLIEKVRFAADLYGVFPVKWLFFGFCSQFFVRSGKGRSSSRRLRSGWFPERAEGVKGPKR